MAKALLSALSDKVVRVAPSVAHSSQKSRIAHSSHNQDTRSGIDLGVRLDEMPCKRDGVLFRRTPLRTIFCHIVNLYCKVQGTR